MPHCLVESRGGKKSAVARERQPRANFEPPDSALPRHCLTGADQCPGHAPPPPRIGDGQPVQVKGLLAHLPKDRADDAPVRFGDRAAGQAISAAHRPAHALCRLAQRRRRRQHVVSRERGPDQNRHLRGIFCNGPPDLHSGGLTWRVHRRSRLASGTKPVALFAAACQHSVMTDHGPDPITLAVLQNRLAAITAEMGEAMLRTSYSQILNSSRDFSIALVDTSARLIAQADHIPVHVGALPWAVRALLEVFPAPREGAVYLLNDPYHGGSHLPDLTIFIPIFARSRPILFSVVRAHQSDIGGATHGAYNAAATEIWQEGLRIPPIRLTDGAGRIREDLVAMLAANVRHARDFRGDLAAMIGAARVGAARIEATLAEFGAATVLDSIPAILDGAERHARQIVTGWRDGIYAGEAVLDDDGHGQSDIRIRARVTKRGSKVAVDLSDSDPQSTGFVNSSHANMQSAVAMAFAFLLDPELPRNDGTFRPLSVTAKPGTIVWAEPPAPVTLCTSHCANEIIEAVITALAPACPDRAMAGWGRRFRIALEGMDPRTRRRFIWHLFQARPGGGASAAGDGWPAAGEWHSAGGLKFGSIEVTEVRFPLFFERHEFRPGSGGAGRFSGGDGCTLRLVVETAGPSLANTAGDGARHGARGMLGGADGKPHDYRLEVPGRPPRPIATKETGIVIPPGSRLLIDSGGGGGWGHPGER